MPSNNVVFDDDLAGAGGVRGGNLSPIARSSVVDFLLRHRVTRTERGARWLVAVVAPLCLAGAVWGAWATTRPKAVGRGFADLTPAERASLPLKERLQLEQIEEERLNKVLAPATKP